MNTYNRMGRKCVGVLAVWLLVNSAGHADPKAILLPVVPDANQPRDLPLVKEGSSVPQDLASVFDTVGIYNDGAVFSTDGGVDANGYSYSASFLGSPQTSNDVTFDLGPAGASDFVTCRGVIIPLHDDSASSLWFLGTAVDGNQLNQLFTVTYTDGSTQVLAQNMSDWYLPQDYPGEISAIKMPYRITASGQKEDHPFYLYSYGFQLSGTKPVKSLTIPNNDDVKIAAITLAD